MVRPEELTADRQADLLADGSVRAAARSVAAAADVVPMLAGLAA